MAKKRIHLQFIRKTKDQVLTIKKVTLAKAKELVKMGAIIRKEATFTIVAQVKMKLLKMEEASTKAKTTCK